MRWVGKHPVFSDLLIGGVLLTPPDNQYSYELKLPNDDGTSGQVLTTDGNGVLTWVTNSAGGTGVSMTNGVDNRIMTATGAQDITGEANLTYDSSTAMMTLSSASSANLPAFLVENTHTGADGGTIGFIKTQDGSDNDEIGLITWQSDDDAGNAFIAGHITGWVADASNNDEAGKIELKVMTDGTGAQQGLTATGSGTTEQVDVSIAHASTSTTTIAGGISANSGGLTYTPASSTLQISTTTGGNLPTMAIVNDNADANGGVLYFKKLQDGTDNDELGIISWYGDDDGGTPIQFASITGRIADASDTDEGGKLELKVLTNSNEYQQALIATGLGTGSRVDVGIGYGATSTTTIAGTLTMGSTAAMTNAGLLSVGNQSNITGLGTISSGTWQGTAIADTYVANDLTISGGTINDTPIGASTASTIKGTTIDADTDFTVGTTVITDGIITFTPSPNDTAQLRSTTHGALSINTNDDNAAAADLDFNVDGSMMADIAGNITLDAGSKQTYIAYNGTNIWNFDVNGMNFKMMALANQNDYFNINVGAEGATTITTVDADTAAANLQITADGTAELAGTIVTLDSAADIELEVGATSNYVDTDGAYRGGNVGPISDTFIPVIPVEFITANRGLNNGFIGLTGQVMYPISDRQLYYAQKIIPKGYTASACIVNGVDADGDATFRCFVGDVSGTATSAVSSSTSVNSTATFSSNIVGDGEKFCTIEFDPGDTADGIYGAKITIAKT